jgi:hypothetical protein
MSAGERGDLRMPAQVEDRLDAGHLFPRADHLCRSPAAEGQAQGFDDDRLPGAGLAGEHVQSLVEVHV